MSNRDQDAAERGNEQDASTVTFTVKSGRGDEREFTFEKGTKVGEAALEVAEEFGYDPSDPTFVHSEEGELDRDKPLAKYHLEGESVTLVNNEGGV
jgi:hypothetical protein